MTLNPIHKVLSSMRTNGVQYLLMGGQACILYGGAEFSRDTDIAIHADSDNLQRLQQALNELQAECIAVPPFEKRFLDMGLAVHFRCRHADALNQRIDVMSRMRGVAEFAELWSRRTTVAVGSEEIELMALPDLVQAKKTQRDKDWPMITRLVEAHFFQNREKPTSAQICFWLRELRTTDLLIDVSTQSAALAGKLKAERHLLSLALNRDVDGLTVALKAEEDQERAKDKEYWLPLRHEIERLRAAVRRRT